MLSTVVTVLLTALLGGAGGPATQPQEVKAGHFKRWAVLSSESVQKTPLAELLLAELSTLDHFELVERDEIAKVVGELSLDHVMGTDAVNERLKLGYATVDDLRAVVNRRLA